MNIATKYKNGVKKAIDQLKRNTKYLITRWTDLNLTTLPKQFVEDMFCVVQTTSVETFNNKIKTLQSHVQTVSFINGTVFKSPTTLATL